MPLPVTSLGAGPSGLNGPHVARAVGPDIVPGHASALAGQQLISN